MQYQVTALRPATFVVPSRAWKFKVYLTAMPQAGWDVASTSYPYQLQMAIDEDLTGVKTKQVLGSALSRLADGIGYNPAVHGGDPKAFAKTIKNVLSATNGPGGVPAIGGARSHTGASGNGTTGKWAGKGLWPPLVANAPWSGKLLADQIRNAWRAAFGPKVASVMTCIAERESSFQPDVWNSYGSPIHYVYGLFQISDVHSANSWWPKSGVHGTEGGLMYDPEYNTRCAMNLYQQAGYSPWVSTSGGCGV
jgi:hypothetical protein